MTLSCDPQGLLQARREAVEAIAEVSQKGLTPDDRNHTEVKLMVILVEDSAGKGLDAGVKYAVEHCAST